MEENINIAEILKDKSKGTKLYSPIFGECTFSFIQGVTDAICVIANDNREFFDYKGLYSPTGECLFFPSKLMRNWSKFQWKRGEVLVSNDEGTEVIFDKWCDDTYTNFYGKHYLDSENENNIKYFEEFVCTTERYFLESKDAVQTYINTIEERLGGKLNRQTLEIEKTQPEFKDGDIVVYGKSVAICRKIYKHTLCFYVSLNEMFGLLFDDEVESSEEYRFATESEKQQLFDALAKKGKGWDAEKKTIVNLKKEDELKPFDKVWVKDNPYGSWEPALFWKRVNTKALHPYMVIGGKRYRFCEPYEGNKHFLDE